MHGVIVIGGGPAALALLLASKRSGTLPALLENGIRIIERGSQFGRGEIGNYAIRSDSHADSFINALADANLPLTGDAALLLDSQRGSPSELSLIGCFLSDLGAAVRREITEVAYDPVIVETDVERIERTHDGAWVTHARSQDPTGHALTFRSRCVVIATGGRQNEDTSKYAKIGDVPLLDRYENKVILSTKFLSIDFQRTVATGKREFRRIAVLGGSHSAMAAARLILASADPCFREATVQILHRNDLRITYQSPESALADGYSDFEANDICPRTGRVFPLAGFRSDSRELLRAQWSLGRLKPTGRLELIDLRRVLKQRVEDCLDSAELIVAALGYQPRGIEIRDISGRLLNLSSDKAKQPMVNQDSEVLDSQGIAIPGVFGLGMAAGYPLAGVYGEPSFEGQANGWALWRSDIGESLARSVVERSREISN